MSSSIDSYHISVDNDDEKYIKQLDNYANFPNADDQRYSIDESESGSGSDVEYKKISYPEAMQRLEAYLDNSELDIVHDYIKSKKIIFERASHAEHIKALLLNIPSIIIAVALGFIPWFNVTVKIPISVLSGILLCLQQWLHYGNYRTKAQMYAEYSSNYATMLIHFDKIKYVSSDTMLKCMESKLECMDKPVPTPVLGNINIFATFKKMEHKRNILIRKYVRTENKLSKWRAQNSNTNEPSLVAKIKEIKGQLAQLNYSELKKKMEHETNM
jgi:hypothetical protein